MQLSQIDLMRCHMVNNIYVCEQHSVLNQYLISTCLGSLYTQDFKGIKKFCPLEVHKAGKITHQLTRNWILAHFLVAQTVPITCRNGIILEQYLSKGINKLNISSGFNEHLQTHFVMHNFSLKQDLK